MRITTRTDTQATVTSVSISDGVADNIRIELPNGTSVCIDLLETAKLGVFGTVWIHGADSEIIKHVHF